MLSEGRLDGRVGIGRRNWLPNSTLPRLPARPSLGPYSSIVFIMFTSIIYASNEALGHAVPGYFKLLAQQSIPSILPMPPIKLDAVNHQLPELRSVSQPDVFCMIHIGAVIIIKRVVESYRKHIRSDFALWQLSP